MESADINLKTMSAEIVTLSMTDQPGSFGWQHMLAWRQLSIIWELTVSNRLTADVYGIPEQAAAYSVALTTGDYDANLLKRCSRTPQPVIFFLDRVTLSFDESRSHCVTENADYYRSVRPRHVFRLQQNHPLTAGLPETVSIYGECPTVTPIKMESGMRALVSLDGVPIIACREHRLFVGANPWQLGVPSVPMLYKVLSSWLLQETAVPQKVLKPYAVIRFDDLPTTAEQLKIIPASPALDSKRSRIIRRLRKFARRTDSKLTLMYSSHFHGGDGNLSPIASIMPKSIYEMELGVRQGVFEVGSHGMVHLRQYSSNSTPSDPREFADLDAAETANHFDRCDEEISRLFGNKPFSFVAPAWGYRAGVTKKLGAERYDVIVDSSQHVESGECDVCLAPSEDDYLHFTETFRPGNRMLTYSNPDFWRCYAVAGIPIHFMQHTDRNWHVLRGLIKPPTNPLERRKLNRTLLEYVDDPRRPAYRRAICAVILGIVNCSYSSSLRTLFWRALTRSSIYSFVRAMRSAGYQCVTVAEFRNKLIQQGIQTAHNKDLSSPVPRSS